MVNNNQKPPHNSDRPPISPDQPDGTDPFNPFETTPIADGGAVAQPGDEIAIQGHLENALISGPSTTPQSPFTPPAPGQHRQQNTRKSYEGSLIETVDNVREAIDTTWTFEVHDLDDPTSLEHAISDPEGDTIYTLRQIDDAYFVYPGEANENAFETNSEPASYPSYPIALAAMVESIDWGSLPVKTPSIWEYRGYTDTDSTFPEYLSGHDNKTCGDHYFANDSADYSIHIESYAIPQQDSATASIITITDDATPVEGDVIYREHVPGQQQAFSILLGLLNANLSKEIYSHTGQTGPTGRVPTIDELLR